MTKNQKRTVGILGAAILVLLLVASVIGRGMTTTGSGMMGGMGRRMSGGMMGGMGMMMSGGMMGGGVAGMLVMLLFWAIVIALLVTVFTALFKRQQP